MGTALKWGKTRVRTKSVVDGSKIISPLEDGDVAGEIAFVNATRGAQKITERGPNRFDGVVMGFMITVIIAIELIFVLAVGDGVVLVNHLRQGLKMMDFITVEGGLFAGLVGVEQYKGVILGVWRHCDVNAAAFPTPSVNS